MTEPRGYRIPSATLLAVVALLTIMSARNGDLLLVASTESVAVSFSPYLAAFAAVAAGLLGAISAHLFSRRFRQNRDTNIRITYRSSGSDPTVVYVIEGDVDSKDIARILEDHAIETWKDSDFTIVRLVNEIERVGNAVLGHAGSDTKDRRSRRGSFQLRHELRQAEIWSTDDLRKFDQVMRLRSAVVHGDRHDPTELNAAIKDATQLLVALRAKSRPA